MARTWARMHLTVLTSPRHPSFLTFFVATERYPSRRDAPSPPCSPPPLSNPITSAICEQRRGLCQASKSQVKLNKWERRGKKRFPFGILGDTLHPSKEIGNGDLLLALFARRRSQPKVIATSSRGHGPSHSHFLLLSILSILVSFC